MTAAASVPRRATLRLGVGSHQVRADPKWRDRESTETHFAAVNNPAATAAARRSLR